MVAGLVLGGTGPGEAVFGGAAGGGSAAFGGAAFGGDVTGDAAFGGAAFGGDVTGGAALGAVAFGGIAFGPEGFGEVAFGPAGSSGSRLGPPPRLPPAAAILFDVLPPPGAAGVVLRDGAGLAAGAGGIETRLGGVDGVEPIEESHVDPIHTPTAARAANTTIQIRALSDFITASQLQISCTGRLGDRPPQPAAYSHCLPCYRQLPPNA